MNVFKTICAAVLISTVLVAHPVRADSWALPAPETYVSASKTVRFRVIPRALSSQLEYFEEKVAEGEAGASAGQRPSARGILERRNAKRVWETVWDRPLVNEVAPVNALVAKDGRYVVTFDDWHAVGTSDNTVVIYAVDGRLIKVLALDDMVPDFYADALPRSVSSIDWSEGAEFSADGEELIIRLGVPSLDEMRNFETVDLRIRLSDGTVVENSTPAWAAAQAQARKVADAKAQAEKEWLEAFKAPLLGPNPPSEPEWHGYLREAFNRIDPDWRERSASTQVLQSPDAKDYAPTERFLKQALLQEDYPRDTIMIATLSSSEHLLTVLEAIMTRAAKGSLKETRVYVALPVVHKDKLTAIFAASGAELIVLDPTVPIPQRPERLQGRE